jgi:hypothetical protein
VSSTVARPHTEHWWSWSYTSWVFNVKKKNAYRAADSCYFMSSSSQAITKYTKTFNMESIDMSAKDISTWQRKCSNLKA